MRTGFLLATVAALSLGATVHGKANNTSGQSNALVQHATNGAFRDGLYLGRLDATSGREAHLSSGRWSRDHDRLSFAAGYRAGYSGAPVELE
jgi:hypothetical protein